jgi:uncharacterized protein (DUF2062 family)
MKYQLDADYRRNAGSGYEVDHYAEKDRIHTVGKKTSSHVLPVTKLLKVWRPVWDPCGVCSYAIQLTTKVFMFR